MKTTHTLTLLAAATLLLSPAWASAQTKTRAAKDVKTYTLKTKVDAAKLLAKRDQAVDMGSLTVDGKTVRVSCVSSASRAVQCRAYQGEGKATRLLTKSKVTRVDATEGIVLDMGDGVSRVAIGGSILSSIETLGGVYEAYPSSRWKSSM